MNTEAPQPYLVYLPSETARMPYAPSLRLPRWRSAILLACLAGPLAAVDPTVRPLIELSQAGIETQFSTEVPAQVRIAKAANNAGIDVAITAGDAGYPGIAFKPAAPWDLSVYGHVEARITNTGSEKIGVSLRLDNDGDWKANPWNGENVWLKPGESGTVTVRFGYSWGKKGFALDPSKVSRLSLFVGKTAKDIAFRVESISMAGVPGEAPPIPADQVRIKPPAGVILGAGAAKDALQAVAKNAQATLAGEPGNQTLGIAIPAGKALASVTLKPAVGRWDLRNTLQTRLVLRNDGAAPVTVKAKLEAKGPTDVVTSAAIAPGATAELVVPYIAKVLWNGEKGTGNLFENDAAADVQLDFDGADAARALTLVSAVAGPLEQTLPADLGSKPPVPGEWTKTFADEFDGTAIDQTKWNIYTENYWDKRTHFTKDNVLVGGGFAKLHYERKTGFPNDDPKRVQTDYACGFLDSYGKWTQRYGYIEARIKLPSAPGLWPAFWMMPDRGVAAGEQWKRASTSDGGMELDIVEHLTRWGGDRYNIAMHWDGYGKEHKSVGSSNNYVPPDKDGFIVAGVLWEPGRLTYFGNGQPILRWENPRVGSIASYPIFNLVSGGWDNDALDDAKLPADLTIDWIRAWQRADLAAAP
jgi:beta-glucanase (GH16 family)